ncbi:unnamed protein product [Vitrella brassicaformis CCMP3155]|uniref:Hypoxanthine phosphoribosyltransferase n=1 Tax=Vitrella brassicaformis (strain CCMP3155) TaxID=1169540 RepID=A0A0G4EIB6_VITBC|nr:unnamed protein product [Vitrella brassicaformis CCMP3155]|mmetsp:Transcript_12515/g.29881  ORF Transcript_12515/g.29881 Transcript_12515/m.29881 type:complete len:216 (-) Transcript_12515:703-1350(-)|eukprot:CEL95622.1 unnamed protein product [Vitrella brassicaformis CCMP3155]
MSSIERWESPDTKHADIEEILYSQDVLKKRIAELGRELSEAYEGQLPLFAGVLTGAFVFFGDLVRAITIPIEVDFVAAHSYGHGMESSGKLDIKKDFRIDPKGREVVLVEDIVDTGLTLNVLSKHIMDRGAKSVSICTLLDKRARRAAPVPNLKFIGFDCPDQFVVGYGIDWAERYRYLPYVGYLRPSVYSKAISEQEPAQDRFREEKTGCRNGC